LFTLRVLGTRAQHATKEEVYNNLDILDVILA